ncbi:MAG TPA: hypothetical protein VFU89_00460 [Rhabdochlamydiaceae bacterium]|nr:hypothetical protein [Rhabdochlamydiaceae bacterium]
MNTEALSRKDTKNFQIFVYYPIRLLKFVLKKLKIRDLFSRYIQDPRSRVDDYSLISLMMHSLLMHLFRSSSKNSFQQSFLRAETSSAAAKFSEMDKNRVPCVRTVDDLFLKLNPQDFKPILPAIFRSLCRSKLFQLHPELTPEGEYAIAVDAQVTHTYYPHSQHPFASCPYCLKRTRGNSTWYLHLDLVASFVAPNGLQIPLLFHCTQGHSPKNCW